MILDLVTDATVAGARRSRCGDVLGLSQRTLERWRGANDGVGTDARHTREGTRQAANALTPAERNEVLEVGNAERFADLSPKQIVPLLADEGSYVASESTIYRVLRSEHLLAHRGRAKAPVRHGPRAHVATGPCQVWSWDITYLRTTVRGLFYYLYLILDVWSRKIVGWEVYEAELADHAAVLFMAACETEHLDPAGIVLHADNGGPMKGATMVATLERLQVLASFSRPGVSNDNPFSEALFRTLKYRPEYPHQSFADIQAARAWVGSFVRWYNTEHLHSAIRFVTPEDRHTGRDRALLASRQAVYLRARAARPDRWSGPVRNWSPITEVRVNPDRDTNQRENQPAA